MVLDIIYKIIDKLKLDNPNLSRVDFYKDTISVQAGGINDTYDNYLYIRYKDSKDTEIVFKKTDEYMYSAVHNMRLVAQLSDDAGLGDSLSAALGQLNAHSEVSINAVGLDADKISFTEFGESASKVLNLFAIDFSVTEELILGNCGEIC